jgi:hypothetical protein
MISYLLFAAFLAGALQGLQPGTGVVTGVIRIQGGAVAAGVRVGAVPVDDVAGASMVSVVETDASGRYRLTNIPEGRYYIVAGRIATPTYYPGGSDRAAAKEIIVEAARVHASVDFAVPPGNNRPPPPPPPIAYQPGEMEAYKAATVEPGADNRLRLLLQFEQRYPKSVYLPEVFAATMEIYAAKRLPAEASVYGNKALKLNPRDAVVLLQFSRLHALVNGDFGTALDFAEKALAAATAMKSQPPRRPLFTVQTWPGWVATLEKNAQTNLVWVKERVNWQRQMILSNMTRRR